MLIVWFSALFIIYSTYNLVEAGRVPQKNLKKIYVKQNCKGSSNINQKAIWKVKYSLFSIIQNKCLMSDF